MNRKVITYIESDNIEDDLDVGYIPCVAYELSNTISLGYLSLDDIHLFYVRSLYTISCSMHGWQENFSGTCTCIIYLLSYYNDLVYLNYYKDSVYLSGMI